jgi:serpin B
LHYPFEGERLHHGYAGLLGKLSGDGKPKGVELSVANALWAKKDVKFEQDFLAVNRDYYAAEARAMDLVGAEPVINKWAEEHTAGRIKDLLPNGVLKKDSVLVLTNAVYFKGKWASQFEKGDTRDEPFHLAGGKKVQVKMMRQKSDLPLGEIDLGEAGSAQVLVMPYKGGDVSMVLVLPNKRDGLPALEAALTAKALDDAVQKAREVKVRVRLPRFTIKGKTIKLNDELQALGMKKPFDEAQADFSGITPEVRPLFIGEVLHQAFVEVNEEGSEAAAATAVSMKGDAMAKDREFVADHPFLFLIRDDRTGCVLFMGRLGNPQ